MNESIRNSVVPNIRPDLHGLDPNCFTAQRLSHATPEHLYLTTRRCFIGPIPEGWLKSHRKHWIKHHLHVNYSSRAATFQASHGVSKQRRVTGLHRHDPTAINKPSFPRPADAQEDEDEDEEVDRIQKDQDGATDRDSNMPGISIPRASEPADAAGQSSVTRANKPYVSPPNVVLSPNSKSPVLQADTSPHDRNSNGQLSANTMSSLKSSAASDRLEASASTTALVPQVDGEHDQDTGSSSRPRTMLEKVRRRKPSKTEAFDTTDSPVSGVAEASMSSRPPPPAHVAFDVPDFKKRNILKNKADKIRTDLSRGTTKALRRSKVTGQIVKVEKMLVRVDTAMESKLPDDYDENISQSIVTSTEAPWRQYMVVCRHTSVASETKFALQIYKTRVIPAVDKSSQAKSATYTIPLGKGVSGVNLYSSLDKTVVVWLPHKAGTRIFILRPKSNADAAEWFTFLRNIMGWHRSTHLQVNIPDLNVSLRLDHPFDLVEAQQRAQDNMPSTDSHDDDDAVDEERLIATRIVERCVGMLADAPEYKSVLDAWVSHHRIGLAWKRYDRLEWVHGYTERKMYGTIAMAKTHDLELRPKQHYPTTARTTKGKELEEPPAVEGFLIRLTSQKGQHQRMGKLFYKRLYFSTHDHYLVFSKPAQAIPPPPPILPTIAANGDLPSAHEISENIPLIYSVNPYPVEDGHIAWLYGQSSSHQAERARHDRDAHDEVGRNASILRDCDGFIDLCAVVKVRHMKIGEVAADDNLSSGSDVDFDATGNSTNADDGVTDELDYQRTFELVLSNGLVIRLQAFDRQTKKEWMSRLHDLVKYWRARHAQDTNLFKEVRSSNLQALHIDEETEAAVGQFANKWEVTQTYASPELYNMCGISRCRAIHHAGPLYLKPRRRALFTSVNAILVHGRLLIFSSQMRKSTGKSIKHIHQTKVDDIDLTDCYLYSGLLTENDLLYQNQTFDATNPGHHALPRMWKDEGWTSQDEDTMTCFVIWQSTSRSWFRRDASGQAAAASNTNDGEAGKRAKIARVTQLGVKGRSIVLKARSRVERDHWVLAVATEIEHLQGRDDVRITIGTEEVVDS